MPIISQADLIELDKQMKLGAEALEAWKARALSAEARCEKLEAVVKAAQNIWDHQRAESNVWSRVRMAKMGKALAALKDSER